MGKKARVLLISMVTMCMSLALIVCATYALFTGQVDVNNHLAAGSLEVGFLWTGTDSYALNDNGGYVAHPATLTGVTISGCEFSGNNKDIVLGEMNVDNDYPQGVDIKDCGGAEVVDYRSAEAKG